MIKKISKYLIIAMLVATTWFCFTIENVSAASVGKVTNVKKTAVTKKYKEIVDASLKKKLVKYKAGYKITWKKKNNVSGYKVYIYYPATKKWQCVKTTKKNNYILTNVLSNQKVKIKIRAYVEKDGVIDFGDYSKTISVKVKKSIYTKNKKGKLNKNFHDRLAAENAFVIQNGYRTKAGEDKIIWSEALYKVCLERAKEISKNFTHNGWSDTVFDVLHKNYGIEDEYIWIKDGTSEYAESYTSGENITMGSDYFKDAMKSWRKSPGHYHNLVSKTRKSGAIACYRTKKDTYWVALFADIDVDKELNETSK